jgi:hypothetical protein
MKEMGVAPSGRIHIVDCTLCVFGAAGRPGTESGT